MGTKILNAATLSLATLFLCLALAGCSRAGKKSDTAATLNAAPQTTITALVWAPDWPAEMHRIAAEFSRENPQIRVDVQFMIGNSVEENIKPKIASNRLPDILSVNPNPYAAELADQGILADLGHSPVWDNMLDSLKPDWTSAKGRHYGISGGVAAPLMYYNKDIFERAGITALPTDFNAFLIVCERLKKAGFTPIMWSGGFPNILANGPFSAGFANNVVARDAGWKQKIADGSLDLDTAEGADIFAKIKLVALRGYAQKGYMDTGYDEGIKLFTEGKTAMVFHGSWASGLLMNGKGFKTGVFIPPWNAAGKNPVPVLGSETGFAVCETPNKAAALQFLAFLYGKGFPIQQNKRQNIPPLKAVQGRVVSNALLTEYVRTVSAFPVTASPYYAFLPTATIELLHALLQDVLFGKITPKQAARLLEASIRNEAQKNNK